MVTLLFLRLLLLLLFPPIKPPHVSLAHLHKERNYLIFFIFYGPLGLPWAHVKYGLL